MKTLQKLGGFGALLQGLIFIELLVMFFAVLPGMGYGDTFLSDPAQTLPFVVNQPLLWQLTGPDLVFAIGALVVVLALHERLEKRAPQLTQAATACGLVAVVLFLALGAIEMVSVPQLAARYSQNPTEAAAAYVGANAVMTGVENGAIFAIGWWTLLVSVAALKTGEFSKLLNGLGIVTALATIPSLVIPILGLLAIIPNLIWIVWLGVMLLRTEPSRQMMTAPTQA